MKPNLRHWLLCTALGAGILTSLGCKSTLPVPPVVAEAATTSLTNTHWRLEQLGDQVIAPAAGPRQLHFVLQSDNPRVAGFSGCNRMFGAYVLDGAGIRFDQMGGTRMACTDPAAMELEQRYLAMFAAAVEWHIAGRTLELRGADGKVLATFTGEAAPPS